MNKAPVKPAYARHLSSSMLQLCGMFTQANKRILANYDLVSMAEKSTRPNFDRQHCSSNVGFARMIDDVSSPSAASLSRYNYQGSFPVIEQTSIPTVGLAPSKGLNPIRQQVWVMIALFKHRRVRPRPFAVCSTIRSVKVPRCIIRYKTQVTRKASNIKTILKISSPSPPSFYSRSAAKLN